MIQLHVNGSAGIRLALPLDNTLKPVGYSEDGVDIDFHMGWEDVMCDVYGPKVPIDVQYFLQDAFIEFDLVLYENSRFLEMISQFQALVGGAASGVMAQAGGLFIQNSGYFRLLISSTPTNVGITSDEQCWNFLYAYPVDIKSKIGTRRKIHHCVFRAIPYSPTITGGQSTLAILYNDTCT